MTDCTALLFVRYPEPGKVKTRLAKTLGPHRAAQTYRELAEVNLKTLAPFLSEGLRIAIYFDPPEKQREIMEWLQGPYTYWSQGGGDLGDRLIGGFQRAFDVGASRVMALASDTLGLTDEIMRKGWVALQGSDVVLGPAEDGGYYLVGLKQPNALLFEGIPWSTDRVRECTVRKIESCGLSYFELPKLEDLDEGGSEKWMSKLLFGGVTLEEPGA